jgi:hypothetical protein
MTGGQRSRDEGAADTRAMGSVAFKKGKRMFLTTEKSVRRAAYFVSLFAVFCIVFALMLMRAR